MGVSGGVEHSISPLNKERKKQEKRTKHTFSENIIVHKFRKRRGGSEGRANTREKERETGNGKAIGSKFRAGSIEREGVW